MTASKLTPKQIAQLGGLAAARLAGVSGMKAKGSKGGRATAAKRGREHYIRAAHKRWGRLKAEEPMAE
jgi:hypothetical protein